MRVEFVDTVTKILIEKPNHLFLTGDLGYNAFEKMRTAIGDRFFNAGAAEQNMAGVAAGLAFEGFKPWIYSIAPFVTYRCFEQTRNDICLHNLPVRLVGNGGGYTYGVMGSTHHTLEDIAILKCLPNMTLYFPCTNNQVEICVHEMSELKGPAYLRLSFSGFPDNRNPLSENTKTLTRTYTKGSKKTIIGVGHAVQIALSALEKHLLNPEDVAIFGIAKFPFNLKEDHELIESIKKTQDVLVIEEHYAAGSISESLRFQLALEFESQFSGKLKFNSLHPIYNNQQAYGTPKFQLTQAGMTPEVIASF